MSLSRRSFVRNLSVGTGALLGTRWVTARGLEAFRWEGEADFDSKAISLSSNENPVGPGKAVMEAIRDAVASGSRTPSQYPAATRRSLREVLADHLGIKPANVLVGCGSTQILVTATHLFTSKDLPLVGSLPTYEECSGYAKFIGAPVRSVPLDRNYRMDLERTLHAAKGAGMLFYCNPSNPVSTLVSSTTSREFLNRLLTYSPQTRVLVDEAYIDYVTDPEHETLIPLALEDPRVIVARTFSKARGMAGLRVGYAVAHSQTIKELQSFHQRSSISGLSMVAAQASLRQEDGFIEKERERNRQIRQYTIDFFRQAGHTVADSQTNFIFVDVGMPVQEFRAACQARGVLVGRPFPPLWTHCRISLGTMDEMKRAVPVFRRVLEEQRAA